MSPQIWMRERGEEDEQDEQDQQDEQGEQHTVTGASTPTTLPSSMSSSRAL
jgi:hypothetical protein